MPSSFFLHVFFKLFHPAPAKLSHPAPAMASLLSSGVPFLLPPDPILKDIFATIKVFPRQELPFYAMDAGS